MLKDASRRKFDIVMAWAIDRLGRSLSDLLDTIQHLEACGPPDRLWIGRNSCSVDDAASMRAPAQEAPPEIPALGPSCVSPPPQLRREWSLRPKFALVPKKSAGRRHNLCRRF